MLLGTELPRIRGKKAFQFHSQERDRDCFQKCSLCALSPFSLTTIKTSSRIVFEPSKMETVILRIFCEICGGKKIKTGGGLLEKHSIEGSRLQIRFQNLH